MVTSLVQMHWRAVYEQVLPHLSLEIYVRHIYVVFLKHMSDKRQESSAVRTFVCASVCDACMEVHGIENIGTSGALRGL